MALRDGITDHPTKSNLTSVVFNAKLEQVRAILDDLESDATGKGASLIGMEDAGGYFTGLNPESVLQLLGFGLKGFIRAAPRRWERKDDDEYYLHAGSMIEINGTICQISSQITKQDGALATDAWYYIYIKVPASGVDISTADVIHSVTAPVYDPVKRGRYNTSIIDGHPVGTLRFLAPFRTDATGLLIADKWCGQQIFLDSDISIAAFTPSDTWTSKDFGLPLVGPLWAKARLRGEYFTPGPTSTIRYRPSDSTSDYGAPGPRVDATDEPISNLETEFLTGSDGAVHVKWADATTTNTVQINIYTYVLPA